MSSPAGRRDERSGTAMSLGVYEDRLWLLIEQGILPSETNDTYDDYLDVLASAWDAGRDAGYGDAKSEDRGVGAWEYAKNPYRRQL